MLHNLYEILNIYARLRVAFEFFYFVTFRKQTTKSYKHFSAVGTYSHKFSIAPSQPSPWKSHIAHLDMHHIVSGINFQIHSVSLTSLVSIHLLIHLSTHLSQHFRSHYLSLLHSFTPGSKPIPLQQIGLLPTLDFFYLLVGLDRTNLSRS